MKRGKLFLYFFTVAMWTNRFFGLNFRQSDNLGKHLFALKAKIVINWHIVYPPTDSSFNYPFFKDCLIVWKI